MAINSVVLAGNLTREPELRQTQAGTSILSFGLAVNERRKNAQGEWEEAPVYVDCSVFGQQAQGLAGILVKGMKVTVQGRLNRRQWTTQDGEKRSKLDVIVNALELPPKASTQAVPQQPQQAAYAQPMPQQQPHLTYAAQQLPRTQAEAAAMYAQPVVPPSPATPVPQQYAQVVTQAYGQPVQVVPAPRPDAYSDEDIPF